MLRISTQTSIAATTLSIATLAIATTAHAAPTPIDLRTWTQEGSPASGNWVVSADGSSVLQTINGYPTFFVSPEEFINTTITGKFRVEDGDNDFMGFVFGYQSPIATNHDPDNHFDFLLFDWKQRDQQTGYGLGREGFSLSRIDGRFGTHLEILNTFWEHPDNPKSQVLATSYGSDKGWTAYTEYDFSLLYQTDRIKIDIDGETIFDISGEFEPGQFGFYNHSQPYARYSGFTQEETPPERVPEPSALVGLALLGVVGLGKMATRKRG